MFSQREGRGSGYSTMNVPPIPTSPEVGRTEAEQLPMFPPGAIPDASLVVDPGAPMYPPGQSPDTRTSDAAQTSRWAALEEELKTKLERVPTLSGRQARASTSSQSPAPRAALGGVEEGRQVAFKLIIQGDYLERLYTTQQIPPDEYTEKCQNLIDIYRTIEQTEDLGNMNHFSLRYRCGPAHGFTKGFYRIVISQTPATLEQKREQVNPDILVYQTLQATQAFINLMNALESGCRQVEILRQMVQELHLSLKAIPNLNQNFEYRVKLKEFQEFLNPRAGWEDLSENDASRFKTDAQLGYNEYVHCIRHMFGPGSG